MKRQISLKLISLYGLILTNIFYAFIVNLGYYQLQHFHKNETQ
ncbi:hypothetical protein pb186bvf_016182 [Paramecium bursaria]